MAIPRFNTHRATRPPGCTRFNTLSKKPSPPWHRAPLCSLAGTPPRDGGALPAPPG